MTASKRVELDNRLNDYSALTRVAAATKKARGAAGNWPVYAAAVGSALAMGTNANASIIYCGSSNNYCEASSQHPVVTATANGPDIHVPLLLSASHQIILDVSPENFGVSALATVFAAKVKIFNSTANSAFALNMAPGAEIGGSVLAANHAILGAQGLLNQASTGGSAFGNFNAGVQGILGVQLDSVSGNTDYGWIRVEFTDQGSLPHTLSLIDWAVNETPGQAIQAGETGVSAAPEPGTMGLGLLAAGAAGVEALRRRRKAKAAVAA